MSKGFTLSAEEAAVILRTNEKNVDATTKRLLQKVVDKRPLSDEEKGELEGIVANEQLKIAATAGPLEVDDEDGKEIESASEETKAHFRQLEREARRTARRRMVLELRSQQPPVPIRDIAVRLKCTTYTVMQDIHAIRETHANCLSENQTLAILGRTCEQYDILYGKAMALGEQYTGPMAKAAFLRTAISALDSKAKLMADTGIIHRVPERQEILVAHADAGTVRERVQKLIAAQEKRAEPVAPEPPELVTTEAEAPQPDAIDA